MHGNIDYASYDLEGVRPVVTMQDGVYVSSGDGTDVSPYILAKD